MGNFSEISGSAPHSFQEVRHDTKRHHKKSHDAARSIAETAASSVKGAQGAVAVTAAAIKNIGKKYPEQAPQQHSVTVEAIRSVAGQRAVVTAAAAQVREIRSYVNNPVEFYKNWLSQQAGLTPEEKAQQFRNLAIIKLSADSRRL